MFCPFFCLTAKEPHCVLIESIYRNSLVFHKIKSIIENLIVLSSVVQILWIPWIEPTAACRCASILVDQTWWRWHRLSNTIPRPKRTPHHDLQVRELAAIENPGRWYLQSFLDSIRNGCTWTTVTSFGWCWYFRSRRTVTATHMEFVAISRKKDHQFDGGKWIAISTFVPFASCFCLKLFVFVIFFADLYADPNHCHSHCQQ